MKKLQITKLTENEKNALVQLLEKEGFIDELRYAKAFVNDKIRFERWGKIKIRYALQSKSINSTIIQTALESYPDESYLQIIEEEIRKKLKSIDTSLNPFIIKQKLMQFGYRRGYESHYLEQVIENLL
ncbi:MAG: RecX family transcriptional regulator [Bacteroidales bacterium]|nr:RecX family transcriptional regulator [Bacteroidales bacterium]